LLDGILFMYGGHWKVFCWMVFCSFMVVIDNGILFFSCH